MRGLGGSRDRGARNPRTRHDKVEQLGGSGEFDARGLTAASANIELEGPGTITAAVEGAWIRNRPCGCRDRAHHATIEGAGNVELYGDVVRGTWEESDGGMVNAPGGASSTAPRGVQLA